MTTLCACLWFTQRHSSKFIRIRPSVYFWCLFCRCFYSTCRLSQEPQWLMSISVLTSLKHSRDWVGTRPACVSHSADCRPQCSTSFCHPPNKENNRSSRQHEIRFMWPEWLIFDPWTADILPLRGTCWTRQAKHTAVVSWLEDVHL